MIIKRKWSPLKPNIKIMLTVTRSLHLRLEKMIRYSQIPKIYVLKDPYRSQIKRIQANLRLSTKYYPRFINQIFSDLIFLSHVYELAQPTHTQFAPQLSLTDQYLLPTCLQRRLCIPRDLLKLYKYTLSFISNCLRLLVLIFHLARRLPRPNQLKLIVILARRLKRSTT